MGDTAMQVDTTRLPPGPRMPGLLQGLRLVTQTTAFFDEGARRWGDTFTIRLPFGAPIVLVSHPDAVREVFTGDDETLHGGEANGVLGPLLGRNSILLLDEAAHERERRLLLPAFHGERLTAYGEVMARVTDEVLHDWQPGRHLRTQDEMQRITLDVILRIVFGASTPAEVGELRGLLLGWLRTITNPLLLWPRLQVDLGRWSPWGRSLALRRRVDAHLREAIARRRRDDTARGTDVLSMLVEARDEDGAPMRDEQIVDEMLTLLVAGHETTATSLSWTLWRLLSEPAVLERARDEAIAANGSDYLDATIKETLRLNPIIPDVGRRLTRPMRIGGWDLPAGAAVAPCIYLTHRRPDVWPDPERFEPERFLGARPKPYEFFPFGGGVRRCLGMALALVEMRIVLSRLLVQVDVQLAPGYRPRLTRRSITFAPSRGMPVVVTGRRGHQARPAPASVTPQPRRAAAGPG
jgi:cytochrome P450